jgi:nucleotide-binding universal stress UspA family protein
MNTLLVPTDFSPDAKYALDFAYELAKLSDSKIRLLHVVEYPGIESFHASGEVNLGDGMDKVFMMQLLKKVKTDIKNLAEDPKYSEVEMHYNVMVGHPWKSISKEIAEADADLVVIGATGVEKAEEMGIGSVD